MSNQKDTKSWLLLSFFKCNILRSHTLETAKTEMQWSDRNFYFCQVSILTDINCISLPLGLWNLSRQDLFLQLNFILADPSGSVMITLNIFKIYVEGFYILRWKSIQTNLMLTAQCLRQCIFLNLYNFIFWMKIYANKFSIVNHTTFGREHDMLAYFHLILHLKTLNLYDFIFTKRKCFQTN